MKGLTACLPTNFYLEGAGGKLRLKKNHNYYYISDSDGFDKFCFL